MLKRPPNRSIGILVVSPTRELAAQIAEEAKQITKFQAMRIQVRHHFGALLSLECQHIDVKLSRMLLALILLFLCTKQHWNPTFPGLDINWLLGCCR